MCSKVSINVIVRNEQDNLASLFDSISELNSEIVIVDTGSTDKSKVIAVSFGVKCHEFPWTDSFADARNEAIRHSTKPWVFLLDADDRIDAENLTKLRTLFHSLGDENIAHVMKVRSKVDTQGHTRRLLDQVRLFRNLPTIRWEYRVHEQIMPSVVRSGGKPIWTDVIIDHGGYQHPDDRNRKLQRNLKLLQLDEAERPDDSFILFNLGRTLRDLGHREKALGYFEKSLATLTLSSSFARKLYYLVADTYREIGNGEMAAKVGLEGLKLFPDDTELLYALGKLHRANGNLIEAEECLIQLIGRQSPRRFDMTDPGTSGFRTRHQLALVYRDMKRPLDAEDHWREALIERPDYVPALLGLAELFLEQSRWAEANTVVGLLKSAAEVESVPPVDSLVLQARIAYCRKDFDLARHLAVQVCEIVPTAVKPKILLSHILLAEGTDWKAAETVLKEILVLDPDHQPSRQNLSMLLSRSKTQ